MLLVFTDVAGGYRSVAQTFADKVLKQNYLFRRPFGRRGCDGWARTFLQDPEVHCACNVIAKSFSILRQLTVFTWFAYCRSAVSDNLTPPPPQETSSSGLGLVRVLAGSHLLQKNLTTGLLSRRRVTVYLLSYDRIPSLSDVLAITYENELKSSLENPSFT